MKYFFIWPLLISVGYAIVYSNIKQSAESGSIKQEVVAITIDGEPEAKKVRTLERPIITRRGIQKKLKKDMGNFFSFPLQDIDSHLERYKPLFSSHFFDDYEGHISATAQNFIDSEIRVVDFIIYGQPIYLGSKPASIRNWQFMIEGYFIYQGNFSGSPYQFEKSTKIITVVETKTRKGNPSGVEIFDIEEF